MLMRRASPRLEEPFVVFGASPTTVGPGGERRPATHHDTPKYDRPGRCRRRRSRSSGCRNRHWIECRLRELLHRAIPLPSALRPPRRMQRRPPRPPMPPRQPWPLFLPCCPAHRHRRRTCAPGRSQWDVQQRPRRSRISRGAAGKPRVAVRVRARSPWVHRVLLRSWSCSMWWLACFKTSQSLLRRTPHRHLRPLLRRLEGRPLRSFCQRQRRRQVALHRSRRHSQDPGGGGVERVHRGLP